MSEESVNAPHAFTDSSCHSQTPHDLQSPVYRVIPGHRNWQIETAVWNSAGFLLFRSLLLRIYVSFAKKHAGWVKNVVSMSRNDPVHS